MALDTKQFDDAINNFNLQLVQTQFDVDNDSFGQQQKIYNDKVAALRLIQDKISTIQEQKNQALAAQEKIDNSTKQISDIKASILQLS